MRTWLNFASLVLLMGVGIDTWGQIPSSQRDRAGLEERNSELQQQARELVIEEEILPPPSTSHADIEEPYEQSFDNSGIESPPSQEDPIALEADLSFQVVDTFPPAILHQPPPVFENGAFLSALVTDPSGIEAVFLHFRPPGGEDPFQTRELERLEEDNFRWWIGEEIKFAQGMEYYITAFDKVHNGPASWASATSPFLLYSPVRETENSKNRLWLFVLGVPIAGLILLTVRLNHRKAV